MKPSLTVCAQSSTRGTVLPRIPAAPLPPLRGDALLNEIARRAFRFFIEKSDPRTGLVRDRASNTGKDNYTIASLAATGYGLAALPAGVERRWISRGDAARRARRTLQFLLNDLPHEHGWFYHFVDGRTGMRAWRSEVSSIDTALAIVGALVCGQYFSREKDIQEIATRLYDRLDWTWLRTRAGRRPDALLLPHGWTPEKSFLRYDWDTYSEGILLYLLGLGAQREPVPASSWDAWSRDIVSYEGRETLTGGPLFLHQMCQGFFDLRGRRDRQGYDYWVSSINATHMNRQFCIDRAGRSRPGYGPSLWGISASDGPKGYRAYRGPGSKIGDAEDGTLCPTAAISSVMFTPQLSQEAAEMMYARYGVQLWGRFGFANAFNVGRNWYDSDVIGIDLGMALIALENHRSGLYWRLTNALPATAKACEAAGLQITSEPLQRPLRRLPASK